jgi:CheY-like chemotaxis protein
MNDKEKISVLVVDDEKLVRDFLRHLLEFEGLQVTVVNDGYQALELVEKEEIDLAFLDIRMPRMNGLETYSRLKAIQPELSVIFMTGYALEEALLYKTKQPGIALLRKPFDDIRRIKDLTCKAIEERKNALSTQQDFIDRRAYVRLDITLEIDYVDDKGEKRSNFSSVKNISPGGLGVITEQDIAAGTPLEMTMKGNSDTITLRSSGVIVWCRQIGDVQHNYEVGIKFTEVDYSELAAMLIRCGVITCPKF